VDCWSLLFQKKEYWALLSATDDMSRAFLTCPRKKPALQYKAHYLGGLSAISVKEYERGSLVLARLDKDGLGPGRVGRALSHGPCSTGAGRCTGKTGLRTRWPCLPALSDSTLPQPGQPGAATWRAGAPSSVNDFARALEILAPLSQGAEAGEYPGKRGLFLTGKCQLAQKRAGRGGAAVFKPWRGAGPAPRWRMTRLFESRFRPDRRRKKLPTRPPRPCSVYSWNIRKARWPRKPCIAAAKSFTAKNWFSRGRGGVLCLSPEIPARSAHGRALYWGGLAAAAKGEKHGRGNAMEIIIKEYAKSPFRSRGAQEERGEAYAADGQYSQALAYYADLIANHPMRRA